MRSPLAPTDGPPAAEVTVAPGTVPTATKIGYGIGNIAYSLKMLANSAPLEDDERHLQTLRIERCFEPDRPRSDDRQPWRADLCHDILLMGLGHLIASRHTMRLCDPAVSWQDLDASFGFCR